MIPTLGARAPYQPAAQFQHHAPNAALLIDFDNVTMGIRSDLGKELRTLLKSDVIRGKVAIQRAYADWRRYPQYIVPLTESSIDLIFAPAYGSSKKNATDLRMAIDAIELVFTRPEIGTFILMTGDSDFSSCVLKLKEYGKYVIGVGMRESSSDLLIQNCDEYYSYHSLSGLTRAGEVVESKEDPWMLVRRAAMQMAANGDVMRTDRLKQVMLDLDQTFDEKKIGYSKFSRFVQEAATKGLIRLRRTENGQHEIVVDDDGSPVEAPLAEARRAPGRDEPRREGRRDGRGPRRDRGDRPTEPRREERAAEEPRAEAPRYEEPRHEEPVAAPAPAASLAEETAVAAEPAIASAAPQGIDQAYALLQHAVRTLASSGNRSVRDGDVKRKMLDLSPGFSEEALGFPKFTRFLRQAHDAEVIDLQRANGGNYEVALPASGRRLPAPSLPAASAAAPTDPATRTPPTERAARVAAEPEVRPSVPASPAPAVSTPAVAAETAAARRPLGGVRGRRGRGAPEGPPPLLPGQVIQVARPAAESAPAPAAVEEAVVEAPEAEALAAEADAAAGEESRGRKSRRGRRGRGGRGRTEAGAATEEQAADAVEAAAAPEPTPASAPEPAPAPVAAAAETAAPAAGAARGRRGRRGAPGADGPPPILPGQAVASPAARTAPAAAPTPAPEPAAEAEPAPTKRARGRGRGRGGAAAPAATEAGFSAERLGLPGDRDAVQEYLTTSYKGVGKKTAESLLDSFGPDLFRVLQEDPDRVREQLGARRADGLIEQWGEDFARRSGGSAAPEAPAATSAAEEPADAGESRPAKSRSRRGGRGGRGRGGRKGKDAGAS